MNKIIKFLEENNKWIVRILVGIGLFFIVKLWLVGLEIGSSCGGGYISLCFGLDFKYHWTILGTVSLILFLVSIFLLFKIKLTKDILKKIQIAFLIFILGIMGKQILFLISPDFKFYMTHAEKQYMDENGKITDLDLYLELITKYCKDQKYGEIVNCAGKEIVKFDTIEENIKVFDYFNKHDYRILYGLVYNNLKYTIGVEKLIENYDNETFQAYIIKNGGLKKEDREKIMKYLTNSKIIDLLNFYSNSIIENQTLIKNDINHNLDKFWKEYDIKIENKIKNISEVNSKILYY